MTDSSHKQIMMLTNGKTVPMQIYEDSQAAAKKFIQSMLRGHSFTAEAIFGNRLWSDPNFRHNAPFCLADMVRTNKLPLEFGNRGGRSTHLYQRR